MGGLVEGQGDRGAAGIDEQSITAFEADLKGNLYTSWNRMSSGSYFPPPVRAVPIPKRDGSGERILGVPTVADRIAQTVVAGYLQREVEPLSTQTATGTGRDAARWMRSGRAERAADATTGSSISMSGRFSTASRMTCCCGRWRGTATLPGCCCMCGGGWSHRCNTRTAPW